MGAPQFPFHRRALARRCGFRFVPRGLVGVNDPAAVPKQIKHVGGLPSHGAYSHDIDVAEIEMIVQTHVLVTDIPAPDNGGAIVDSQRFVMHAMVELLEVCCEIPTSTQRVAIVAAVKQPK